MPDLLTRDLRLSDLDDLHAIASHWPTVRQLGGWPWPADRAFTASRAKPFAGAGFVWAIEENGRMIGSMGITDGALGYALHQDVWGRGIATAVARRAVDHAFAAYDLSHISATAWADNTASRKVLRKLGFEHWYTGYEFAKARRIPTLSHAFRLSRARWRDLSAGAQ